MNWKLKMMQMLECFSFCEGSWYEREWESFGITPEERKLIEAEYENYETAKRISSV